MHQYKNILYKEDDGLAEITLNRPEKMNSLDETLISELTGIFKELNNKEKIKVVVLTGAGGNFCSGLYLDYLQKIAQYDLDENKKDSMKFRDMLLSIYNCSKPVIAKVHGYALAGGCGIATCCDIIIADEMAKFGYTEVKIGFIPAIVMVFLLKRITEAHAKELLLTSRIIDAKEAERMGLINKSVPSDELDKEIFELCNKFKKCSANSVRLTKEMIINVSSMNLTKALNYACDVNAEIRMTEGFKKGIAEFLNAKTAKDK